MRPLQYALLSGAIAVLGGCATPNTEGPAAVPPPVPDQAERAPPVAAQAPLPPTPADTKPFDDEARRLASMSKAYFSVFKIDEAVTGLTPRPNANGVYDLQKPPRGDKLRIAVAQQAKAPAKLAIGTYNVTLDAVFDYIELQACKSGPCAGKLQKIVRSLPKVMKIQLTPQNQYYGVQDVSLANPGTPGNYRSTYSNVVLTVRRITVAPVIPPPQAGVSATPARQQ